MSGYLINTVVIESQSTPKKVLAGTLLTDSSVITAVQGAGGVVGSSTDPVLVAAAAVVVKMRSRAQNEDYLNAIMMAAYLQSLNGSSMQHVKIDVPLATIQAQTSGTPFNVGAALPANARLLRAELNVLAPITGGTITACKAFLESNASDAAGALIGGAAGSDVFTATTIFTDDTGSEPYVSRGGQQLALKITATGDTLAHATTGHLEIDLFYSVLA